MRLWESITMASIGFTETAVCMFSVETLTEMVMLEQVAWPEDVQATSKQLKNRIETFPEGLFGVYQGDHLIGMASSQIIEFDPEATCYSWIKLTANGWISRTHRPDSNCLHCVSICVHPDFRNRGIGTILNQARLDLAARLNLRYVLTDTRLPGLADYLKRHNITTPQEYIDAIIKDEIREPAVHMYLRLGFKPLGLIANCMESDRESADYGLAMVKYL